MPVGARGMCQRKADGKWLPLLNGTPFLIFLRNAGFHQTTRNPSVVQLELSLDSILDQVSEPALLGGSWGTHWT